MNTIKLSILACFFIICYPNLQAQEPCWFNTPPTCKDPNFVYAVGIGQDGDVVKMKNRAEAEAIKMYMAQVHGIQLEDATYKDIVENGLEKIRISGRPLQYKVVRQGADSRRYNIFYTLLILPRNFSNDARNIVYPNEGLCDGKTPADRGGKIAIAIGAFSGYKNNEAETNIRNAFVGDGRFIVSNAQNTYHYGSNQQTSADVDYTISGTCNLTQRAETKTTNMTIKGQNYPITTNIPEIVNVDLTLTNSKGEIVVSTTYNLNNLSRISGNIFPVKLTVKRVNGKKIEIVRVGDGSGTVFNGDTYNVYEVYSNGGKSKIGALKIGKTLDDCKITNGEKEIAQKFNSGANLVVER